MLLQPHGKAQTSLTILVNLCVTPTGKQLHNHGKKHTSFLIGKSTISMAIFHTYVAVDQRVSMILVGGPGPPL